MIVNPKALDIIVDDSNKTVREYLQTLLLDLWWQGEQFNSKRPFGSSGWNLDVIFPISTEWFYSR